MHCLLLAKRGHAADLVVQGRPVGRVEVGSMAVMVVEHFRCTTEFDLKDLGLISLRDICSQ